MQDLDSLQHAEARMLVERASGLQVIEVDSDDGIHLDATLIAAVFGGVQCVLAAVSIWMVHGRANPADEPKLDFEEVKRCAEIAVEAGAAEVPTHRELSEVLAEAEISRDRFRCVIGQYEVEASRSEGGFRIRGRIRPVSDRARE